MPPISAPTRSSARAMTRPRSCREWLRCSPTAPPWWSSRSAERPRSSRAAAGLLGLVERNFLRERPRDARPLEHPVVVGVDRRPLSEIDAAVAAPVEHRYEIGVRDREAIEQELPALQVLCKMGQPL